MNSIDDDSISPRQSCIFCMALTVCFPFKCCNDYITVLFGIAPFTSFCPRWWTAYVLNLMLHCGMSKETSGGQYFLGKLFFLVFTPSMMPFSSQKYLMTCRTDITPVNLLVLVGIQLYYLLIFTVWVTVYLTLLHKIMPTTSLFPFGA